MLRTAHTIKSAATRIAECLFTAPDSAYVGFTPSGTVSATHNLDDLSIVIKSAYQPLLNNPFDYQPHTTYSMPGQPDVPFIDVIAEDMLWILMEHEADIQYGSAPIDPTPSTEPCTDPIRTVHTPYAAARHIYLCLSHNPRIAVGMDAYGQIVTAETDTDPIFDILLVARHECLWSCTEDKPTCEDDIEALIDTLASYLYDEIDGIEWFPDACTTTYTYNMETDMINDVAEYIIPRDYDRSISFTGTELASVKSQPDQGVSNYSGSTGRWIELTLYRTTGGKYICERVGRTQWQGEHNRHEAIVCDTHDEIVKFLGLGWLSKQLYDAANINYVESVD